MLVQPPFQLSFFLLAPFGGQSSSYPLTELDLTQETVKKVVDKALRVMVVSFKGTLESSYTQRETGNSSLSAVFQFF